MKLLGASSERAVGVVEGGKTIGRVTTDRILAKLVDPRN